MSITARPPKIFISYSSIDRDAVAQIHSSLESAGLDVWRDQTRLETDWSREIAYALADAEVLCLMWSENASNSKYVKHEWLTARALEKPIYICCLGKYKNYPAPLHNRQDVRFEDIESGSEELIGKLKAAKDFHEDYDYTILPKNSYISFNPNPHFTGRQRDLLELYLKMIGNLNKIGINQVGTVGMGGIGKTQLAVEFAYRFSFAFEAVFWVQAARLEEWRKEFVSLAKNLQLKIENPESADADERYIYALRKYFKAEGHQSTLVIMDNVEEPGQLNNDTFLFGITPLTLGCDILFTTRRHFHLPGVSAQAVNILSSQAAYNLLTDNRQPDTPEEAQHAHSICNAVGYLPLAIVLASGYLNKYKDVSFADYHEELLNNKLEAIDIGEVTQEELATRHAAAVGITLQEDWKKLTDGNARLLFQLAGQFGEAEIIPKARLGLLAGIEPGKSKLHHPLEKAINLLHDLSLAEKLESDVRAIRLHPLVRDFANGLIPVDKQPVFKATAAEKLKTTYFDYVRLKTELEKRGINALLADMQIAINWWGKEAWELQELTTLQSALRLSANPLTLDPAQLPAQLLGRLKALPTGAFNALLQKAKSFPIGACLRPLFATLTPPGGPLMRTLEGHTDGVTAVAITPDGKLAVSASIDKTLKVWDIVSGEILQSLDGHSEGVIAVAITPDGKLAVSSSDDKTLKVWDIESGEMLQSLEGHSNRVTAVAITPDGKRAVSASIDKTLKVWDIESGKSVQLMEGHSEGVTAVAITPDGKLVISASIDKTLKVWNVDSGENLQSLEGHNFAVNAVAIMPDGKRSVSASWDSTLKVWDIESGEILQLLESHSVLVNAVAITPDGKRVFSASLGFTLIVLDIGSGKVLQLLEGHSDSVKAVAITSDGKLAVSASIDKTLKVWDIESGENLQSLGGHIDAVNAVAITPDDKWAVSASDDNTLKVWDIESGEILHSLEDHSESVNVVAITPDGKLAISASWDNTLKVWDIESGENLQSLEGHGYRVSAVAITPDGKRAVSASVDSTLKVWDIESGEMLHSLEGHTDGVTAVAITPDGKVAVSASYDYTLKVWDIESGENLQSLEGHIDSVNDVGITTDGKRAVSASNDKTLKVWDIERGEILQSLEGHSDEVHAVAITPDGQCAVSASRDMTLKVWDIESGENLHSLEGHKGWVNTVAIISDGKRAVSASDDKALKVWDIESGNLITQFTGDSPIPCCAINSDGKTIVVGASAQVHFLRLEGVE
jgi:WD40 repeat protein